MYRKYFILQHILWDHSQGYLIITLLSRFSDKNIIKNWKYQKNEFNNFS